MAAQIGSSSSSHLNLCNSSALISSTSSSSSSSTSSASSSQTIFTIASEIFCSFEEFCSPLPGRASSHAQPKSPQMIDSLSTLRFMVAKAKALRIFIKPQLPWNIPLKPHQVNIIPSIPTTHFKYYYVEQARYKVVDMSTPVILATTNIMIGIAATAVGFNSSGQPVCRGIIHFDKIDNSLLEKFLNQMIAKGATRIYLDIAIGIGPSNEETFIKKIKLNPQVSIEIRNQLLNPYHLNLKQIKRVEDLLSQDEGSSVSLDFPIDLIVPRLTMGICPDGAVFVVKNSVWKTVNISKILRLYSFWKHKESQLCSLVKNCKLMPSMKEETIQDLIAILRDNPFPIQTKFGEDFLAGIDFFLKHFDHPF